MLGRNWLAMVSTEVNRIEMLPSHGWNGTQDAIIQKQHHKANEEKERCIGS